MNRVPRVRFISDRDIRVDVIRTTKGDRCRIRHLPLGLERGCALADRDEALRRLEARVLRSAVADPSAAAKISPGVLRVVTMLRAFDDEGLRQWLAAPTPHIVLATIYEYARRGSSCPFECVYANADAMRNALVREVVTRPELHFHATELRAELNRVRGADGGSEH